jgi:hypothetical protein
MMEYNLVYRRKMISGLFKTLIFNIEKHGIKLVFILVNQKK